MAYVRFDDIDFDTDDRKEFCRLLYSEINEFEEFLMRDEEFGISLAEISKHAAQATFAMVEINKKILFAMKMVFLYYTGVSPAMVLDGDDEIDIFDLDF